MFNRISSITYLHSIKCARWPFHWWIISLLKVVCYWSIFYGSWQKSSISCRLERERSDLVSSPWLRPEIVTFQSAQIVFATREHRFPSVLSFATVIDHSLVRLWKKMFSCSVQFWRTMTSSTCRWYQFPYWHLPYWIGNESDTENFNRAGLLWEI